MKTKSIKPFLFGSLKNVDFTIDADLNVYCSDEIVKKNINDLIKKSKKEINSKDNMLLRIGYLFTDRKNGHVKVSKYIWYRKEKNNLIAIECVNSFIGNSVRPFIEGVFGKVKYLIDTNLQVSVFCDSKIENKDLLKDYVKMRIEQEIKSSNHYPGYYPTRIWRVYEYFIETRSDEILRVYLYENPNRYKKSDPNVKY